MLPGVLKWEAWNRLLQPDLSAAGGWRYVAVNALSLNSGVSSAQLKTFLDADLAQAPLFSTADLRASSLRSRLKGRFPGVNWNVAVRRNARSSDWGVEYDSSADYFGFAVSGGDAFSYFVWATCNMNQPPIPDAGGPYTVGEGTPLQLDASATVNYGDGTPTQTVTPVNKRFVLTRTASTAGDRTVTVTVNDGTDISTNRFVVTAVTLAPEQIYTFEGPGEPVAEGIPLSVTQAGVPRNGNTQPHRYNVAGTYQLTLRITDDDGATSVLTNMVTVADAVPQIIEFYPTVVDGVEVWKAGP